MKDFVLVLALTILLFGHCCWGRTVVVSGYTGLFNPNTNVSSFKGIRYAKPPVGSLRFMPPVAAEDGTGQLALEFGPVCPQLPNEFFAPSMMRNMSEDCLTLNVWTDLSATPFPGYPVMVFLYGGAFINGGSSQPVYNGSKLARKNVVVVTVNYRLGPLGFFSHPQLGSNVGLLDQRLALQWVQRNIHKFGGNPSQVTLFGESAGGISTCLHITSSASWPLFHAAIIESGGCALDIFPTSEMMYPQAASLATAVGCDFLDTDCLQNASVMSIIKALPLKTGLFYGTGVGWGPTIDEYFLVTEPRVAFQSGLTHDIPLIIGTNFNEGSLFTPSTSLTVSEYHDYVRKLLIVPQLVEAVLLMYPASLYDNPAQAWEQLITDSMFVCPSRFVARSMANDLLHASFRDVYVYSFRHTNSWSPQPSSFYGAYHTSELPYWSGNEQSLLFGQVSFSEEEKSLSSQIQQLWTQFAREGAPGHGWPRYDFFSSKMMVLSSGWMRSVVIRKIERVPRKYHDDLIPKSDSKNVVQQTEPTSIKGRFKKYSEKKGKKQ